MAAGDPTVQIRDLTVQYTVRTATKAARTKGAASLRSLVSRRSVPVHALTDVTLDLYAGEVVGLVGGNGAGKSTLLRTVAGLLPPTAGTIHAAARPLLLSVGAALLPELTGRRNAYLGCLAQGMTPQQARAAADDAIAFAGLGDAIDRPLGTYSSGMAARLRFAITTTRTHEILLVDEALSVGDARFAEAARARMRALSEAAGTVVLVSHSPKQLLDACTRGIRLEHGRLVDDGPIGDVLDRYTER